MKLRSCCLLFAAGLHAIYGQTRVDVRTQSKSIDFSGQATKTTQTGATLPAHCATGETFFLTTAAAGKNLYLCSPADTWTQSAAGEGIQAGTSDHDKILTNDGSVVQWRAAGGDVTGPVDAARVTGLNGRPVNNVAPSDGDVLAWNTTSGGWTPGAAAVHLGGDVGGAVSAVQVSGLQGRPVSGSAPSDGNALRWNASAGQWQPADPITAGAGLAIDGSTVSIDDSSTPIYYTGTSAPSITCMPGRDYYVDTGQADFYYCGATGAWTKTGKASAAPAAPVRGFGITLDGGGTAVATGVAGYVTIPYACTITGWSTASDQAGNISVEIWKAAQAIPSSANRISGTAPPSLSGTQWSLGTTLTGWTTAVSANDVVAFNVASATVTGRVTVQVFCQ